MTYIYKSHLCASFFLIPNSFFILLQGLNTEDYKRVMKVVEQAILSTDLALYFRKKDRFLETANTGEIDWQEQEKKERECGFKVWLFWGLGPPWD